MNKKEKYEELAKRALRECMKSDEFSQRSITAQISALYTKYDDTVEQTELKEYLNTLCPFFMEIDKEKDIPEFFDILKETFKNEYQKFECNNFKPTQVLAILLVLEDLWGYSELENDVIGKIEKFSSGAFLVAKLYFWGVDEENLWEFCSYLNEKY